MNDAANNYAIIGLDPETLLVVSIIGMRSHTREQLTDMANQNLLLIVTDIETARKLWKTVIADITELLLEDKAL